MFEIMNKIIFFSPQIKNLHDLPEKNEAKIEELKEELDDLEGQLEPANKLLQTKMDQVNDETIVN